MKISFEILGDRAQKNPYRNDKLKIENLSSPSVVKQHFKTFSV